MQVKKRRFNSQNQTQEMHQSLQNEENRFVFDQLQPEQLQQQNEIPKNSSIAPNSTNINMNNNNQTNNLLYKISILSPIKKHPRQKGRKNMYSMTNEQNYYDDMTSPLGQQHISHYSNTSSIHNLSLDDGNLNGNRNMNLQNTNFLDSDFSMESVNNSSLINTPKFDLIESRQISQGRKNDILSRQRKQITGKYQNQLPSISNSGLNSNGESAISTRKQSILNQMQTPQKIVQSIKNIPNSSGMMMNKKIAPLFNQNTNSTSNNSNVLTNDNDQSNYRIPSQEKQMQQSNISNDYQNQYNPALYGMKARKLIDLSDQSQQFGSKNTFRQLSQNSKDNSLNNSIISSQQQIKSNNAIFHPNFKQPQITYHAVYGSESDPVDKKDIGINTPVKQISSFQKEERLYNESISQTPEVKSTIKTGKLDRSIESQISQTVSVNNNIDDIKQFQCLSGNNSQKQTPHHVHINKNTIIKNNSHQPVQIKILKNKTNNNNTNSAQHSNLQNKSGFQGKLSIVKTKQMNTEGGAYSENDTYLQKIKGEQSTTAPSSNFTSKKNSLILVKQPPNNRIRTNPKIIRINQIQNMTELFPENAQQVSNSQIIIQDGKIVQKSNNHPSNKQIKGQDQQEEINQNNQIINQQLQNSESNQQSDQKAIESNYVTFKDIPIVATSSDPTQYTLHTQTKMLAPIQSNSQNQQQLQNSSLQQTQQITMSPLANQTITQSNNKLESYQNTNDQEIKEDLMRNSGGNIHGIEYTKDGVEIHKSNNLSSCFSHSALSQCSVQTIGLVSRKKINLTMLVAYGEQLQKLNEIFQENEQSINAPHHLIDNPAFLQNLLQKCHWFLDIINTEKDLEQLPLLFKDEKSRKIIKQSMVFERCVIVLIAQNLLDRDVFSNNYKYLKGIVNYAYTNYINTITIINHKMPNQFTFSKMHSPPSNKNNHPQNINNQNIISELNNSMNQDEKLNGPIKNTIEDDDEEIDIYTKQQFMKMVRRGSIHSVSISTPQKPQQKWIVTLLNQIRQNNEISINSFKTISKNDKEFYSYILNFIKSIDRTNSVNSIFNSMLQYFSLYLIQKQQQMEIPIHFSIPFLQTAPAPYLPDIGQRHQYTLVLDLDETLIHYTEAYNNVKQFVVRPYVQTFLQQISEFYEIVVFTAGMPDYANWVIDNFDTKGYIKHRLYRQHTLQIQNTFIKDLSRIGRDLSKVIIIDNLAENFQFQPDNGIFIREWTEDPTDTALAELLPLLKEIAIKKSPDVRVALKQLKEQIQRNIEEGVEYPHLNLKL